MDCIELEPNQEVHQTGIIYEEKSARFELAQS